MTDLATYLDYGSAEISDDLNPERARQPEKQEPSNERKKMLVDMLGTSLEYGRAAAYEGRWEGWRTGAYNALGGEGAQYWDEYSVPWEDIIPGADRWLQNESGFTYDELIELLEVGEMQDGIDWAWSLTGAPTVQLDTGSNVVGFLNPFSAVIDYGHAAWDLASGDVSGARDAWDNVGDRLYGYDPNPYGSQAANVLGVHNWQDAIWAGLDVIDLVSLGFGGEIIRPMRQAMAGIARRQRRPEAARAIERRLSEEFAERAARGADAELRTMWDNISTGEREVIEADYRAVQAEKLEAALNNDDGLDLFDYYKNLADVSGYSAAPGNYGSAERLYEYIRTAVDYPAGRPPGDLHYVFRDIEEFARERLFDAGEIDPVDMMRWYEQQGPPGTPTSALTPESMERAIREHYTAAWESMTPEARASWMQMGIMDSPDDLEGYLDGMVDNIIGGGTPLDPAIGWGNLPEGIERRAHEIAAEGPPGTPEDWMYYTDRSGRRVYKGQGSFENPDALVPQPRMGDAGLDLSDTPEAGVYSSKELTMKELGWTEEQYEQARTVWANDPQRIEDQVAREAERLDRELAALNPDPKDKLLEWSDPVELLEYSDLDPEVRDAIFDIADGLKRSLGEHAEGRNLIREVEEYLGVTGTPEISDYNQFLLDNPDYDAGLRDAEARWDDPTLDPSAIWRAADDEGRWRSNQLEGPPGTPEGYNRPDGDPLDRRPGPEQREPYPDTFTPDEVDEIVRNEGGLTDAEIEREMRRSGAYDDPYGRGGELTDADLDRLARPEPGVSADPLDEEIAREIGPGPGPGWKTAADIPASKASQVWRTPDNVWGTATDEELLVLLHHAKMETRRKIDPSLSMIGENRQREFLAAQQADWASRELTNRGYTPTRGIDDPWQELNWGNIGVDRHPSGELFKDFDYEDTLLGIQAKVKSWYDTEYWPQQVAGSKTGLQTPPDLDLDIGPFGQRMGWWLPGTGSEFNADGTQMRLRFYSDQKLIAYMDDRYFQPGRQPRALEYRKMFEDEYARRRAIEAETGKPYDPGPRPPGHPSTWRLPEE